MKPTNLKYLLLLACLPASVSASITIDLSADQLKTANGSAMPESGLAVLVADTLQNGFTLVSPSANLGSGGALTVGGDDIVVGRWDLSGFNTAGALYVSTGSLNLSSIPGWSAGDPLQLFWFPTLTTASSSAAVNTPYGTYRDPISSSSGAGSGVDASDPWFTPADGGNIELRFFTTDAVLSSGSNPPVAGEASLVVVPEPSLTMSLAAAASLGFAVLRRRKK